MSYCRSFNRLFYDIHERYFFIPLPSSQVGLLVLLIFGQSIAPLVIQNKFFSLFSTVYEDFQLKFDTI
jgi:hypothetical protein